MPLSCLLERMVLQNRWASFRKALDQLRQMELLDVLCKTAVVETVHHKVGTIIHWTVFCTPPVLYVKLLLLLCVCVCVCVYVSNAGEELHL